MNEDTIKKIVRETIEELKKAGVLRVSTFDYKAISAKLREHYKKHSPKIENALKELEGDPYFDIIELYYRDGCTIEEIAEALDVEVSTITRNKKRLCKAISDIMQK